MNAKSRQSLLGSHWITASQSLPGEKAPLAGVALRGAKAHPLLLIISDGSVRSPEEWTIAAGIHRVPTRRASPLRGRKLFILTAAFEVAAGTTPTVLRRRLKVREVELGLTEQNPHLPGGAPEAQAGEATHPRSPTQ